LISKELPLQRFVLVSCFEYARRQSMVVEKVSTRFSAVWFSPTLAEVKGRADGSSKHTCDSAAAPMLSTAATLLPYDPDTCYRARNACFYCTKCFSC
jgi:hypothetical protein